MLQDDLQHDFYKIQTFDKCLRVISPTLSCYPSMKGILSLQNRIWQPGKVLSGIKWIKPLNMENLTLDSDALEERSKGWNMKINKGKPHSKWVRKSWMGSSHTDNTPYSIPQQEAYFTYPNRKKENILLAQQQPANKTPGNSTSKMLPQSWTLVLLQWALTQNSPSHLPFLYKKGCFFFVLWTCLWIAMSQISVSLLFPNKVDFAS